MEYVKRKVWNQCRIGASMISVCHSRLHSHSMSTMHHILMVVVAFAVYYGSLKLYTRIGLIVG